MKRIMEKRAAAGGGVGTSSSLRGSRGILSSGRISGSASGTPRASKHAGKAAAKFQFDLIVESVQGLSNAGNYAVKWGRGVKVANTKPKMFNPAGGSVSRTIGKAPSAASTLAVSQKLTLLCTLYRGSNTAPFDEKDAKLSVVHYPGRGEKSVGKVHFNLAEFAGVPSSTTKKTFTMSNAKGISVTVTILSSFMGSGTRGPGSISASSLSGLSMASSQSGVSGASGSTTDDLSDLSDDLSVPPAAPSNTGTTARTSRSIAMPKPGAPPGEDVAVLKKQLTEAQNTVSQYQKRALAAEKEASELKAQKNAEPIQRQSSSDSKTVTRLTRELETARAERDSTANERDQLRKERDEAVAKDTSAMVVSMQQTQDNLIRENEEMRKNNEELMSQLDEMETERERLESQSNSGAHSLNATAAKASEEEIASLKNKVTAKDAEINLLRNKVRDAERATAEFKKSTEASDELASLKTKNAKFEAEIASAKSKIKSHEAHAAKMKKTYQELTDLYTKMRTDYMTVQGKYKKKSVELAELRAGKDTATSASDGTELAEAISRETKAKEELQSVTAKEVEVSRANIELSQQVADLNSKLAALEASKSNSGEAHKELENELKQRQVEFKDALDLVEKLRDEADLAFQEFADTKRSLEARCKDLVEERDATANEGERLRKRRGIETDSLKKDVERSNEEMERLRKKKNTEITALSEERDSALQRVDRMKQEHERRLRELEDEIDSKSGATDAEQKLRTLEVQLTAARSREQNLDDEVTKVRTLLERKAEQLKTTEEHLKTEKTRATSLAIAGNAVRSVNGTGADAGSGSGLDEEVIHQLIEAKLKLADSEEEILKYKNLVRKFKDGKHKQVLERIAEHASSLEVKLNEARTELAEYRSNDPSRSTTAAVATGSTNSPRLYPD